MRHLLAILHFVVLLAFCDAIMAAGTPSIALLMEVEVRNDAIVLANLLPEAAPESLKDATREISLGRAPQNGTVRRISRQSITAAINRADFSGSALSIPEFITVKRQGRFVTREEVFRAIEVAFARNPSGQQPKIQWQDLTLEAAIEVPVGAANLEVTQIAFDEALGRARFRLQSASTPAIRPFFATAPLHAESRDAAESNRKSVLLSIEPQKLTSNKTPVLVEAGRFARLHLHSQDSDMQLEVKPLQRGRLGEIVRVRLPQSAKTLQARVIGKGSLDATF